MDDDFNEMELKMARFASSVNELMESEAFQMLDKIKKTNDDIRLVSVNDEEFVKWITFRETASIPWMRKVLQRLSDAHVEKLKQECSGLFI